MSMRLGYKQGHYDQLNQCVHSTDYGLSEYTHLEVVCNGEIALQAQTGHFLFTARIGPARLLHSIFLDVCRQTARFCTACHYRYPPQGGQIHTSGWLRRLDSWMHSSMRITTIIF
jgi:hypothetical protein